MKPLCGVFDLVATAVVLNMKQFNGSYGCPTCLHPGKYYNTQVYPPSSEQFSIRTCEGIEKAIQEGKLTCTIVEGIKGVSPLTGYMPLVNGVPRDYMHCVLEGVVKVFLKVWTESRYGQQPYSIRRYLSDIDTATTTCT